MLLISSGLMGENSDPSLCPTFSWSRHQPLSRVEDGLQLMQTAAVMA